MMVLEKASPSDLDAVCALYASAIGREGCTWNEYYPTREDAEADISRGDLWVLRADGRTVGAVSVVFPNELDGMECFSEKENVREIARVTVDKALAGHGCAARMLTLLFGRLKEEGASAVRLSAAVGNRAAIAVYRRLGFAFLGRAEMYGNTYFLCEKSL